MQSFGRAKIYRPRWPLFLRPEALVLFAGLGYFAWTKANFYGPLYYQQLFPQGAARSLATSADRLLTENGVDDAAWALPVNKYRREAGECFRMLAAGEGEAAKPVRGDPSPFNVPLANERNEQAALATYVCQHEGADQFYVVLARRAVAQLFRAPRNVLGLELDAGAADVRGLAGGAFDLLLPNGVISLRSRAGFLAHLERSEENLRITVKEGEARADVTFAENYRGPGLGLVLAAAGPGKFRVPDRGLPLKDGKAVRLAPSGTYDEAH